MEIVSTLMKAKSGLMERANISGQSLTGKTSSGAAMEKPESKSKGIKLSKIAGSMLKTAIKFGKNIHAAHSKLKSGKQIFTNEQHGSKGIKQKNPGMAAPKMH